MHELATTGSAARGGFIHVPYLPQQVSARPHLPSMALDTIERALRVALRAALRPAPGRIRRAGRES